MYNADAFSRAIAGLSEGVSLRELAERTGVSAPTLSRLARGGLPDIENFFRLCAALHWSPDMFSTATDEPECPQCAVYAAKLARIRELATPAPAEHPQA